MARGDRSCSRYRAESAKDGGHAEHAYCCVNVYPVHSL